MTINDLETAIIQLIATLAEYRPIRAIGLSGGECPDPDPGAGDIDLFVYCTEIPSREKRLELLSSIRQGIEQIEVGKLEGGHWGQGDCFLISGVEAWLLYFTVGEARAELEAILNGQYPGRLDSYYYPIGRCAMWKNMRALYDPDGVLESFRRSLENYPQKLARAVLQHHLAALGDVEDLERAVGRKDVFFYHFALDLALDHFLQGLFTLNKEFFPSRKRSESYLRGFKLKPSECEDRLRQVIALGGQPETLAQSYELWNDLVSDLKWVVPETERSSFGSRNLP